MKKRRRACASRWTGCRLPAPQVTIDGKPAGAADPGEDFYRALLQDLAGREARCRHDLKKALLGEKHSHGASRPASAGHRSAGAALRVNDTVTLEGTLFGIRDATQIHMFDRGRKTRFDLAGHARDPHRAQREEGRKSAAHPAGYEPSASAPRPATAWSASRGR